MTPDYSWTTVRNCMRRAIAGFAGVIVVCGLVTPADSADKRNLDGFAQCVASKKALMYGSFLCLHCDDQKKLFGSSFKYIPYVECSVSGSREMTFSCKASQIHYTPTWILANGERLIGLQPLKILSEKTGCSLP